MPIPLGVLAVAGAGAGPVAAGNAYEWLETVSVGTAVASISFSNLNSTYGSTYQHLQLRMVTRDTRATDGGNNILIQLNGDTGSNYATHRLRGANSAVTSSALSSQTNLNMAVSTTGNDTANAFAANIIDILDPFETSKNTTLRNLQGFSAAVDSSIELRSGFWNNTAALTTIYLVPTTSGNFEVGSRFSLYGLRSS